MNIRKSYFFLYLNTPYKLIKIQKNSMIKEAVFQLKNKEKIINTEPIIFKTEYCNEVDFIFSI